MDFIRDLKITKDFSHYGKIYPRYYTFHPTFRYLGLKILIKFLKKFNLKK